MANPKYSVTAYGEMIADRVRLEAYEAAIRAACRPGACVVDIGSGAGILSLLACRYGAARVYAIEPSDVIEVGREIAAANGVADRIVFIQSLSTAVELPEPVDLVIADVRGVLPMTGSSLATMRDARRLLAPGGHIIPACDTVRVAAVESPSTFAYFSDPWRRVTSFDMRAAERLALQSWIRSPQPVEALVSEAGTIATLEYATNTSNSVRGACSVRVTRAGTVHGLCAWFDTRLYGSIGFSNAPGLTKTIYGQAFFPLTAPVEVAEGDSIDIELLASHVHDDYVWTWATIVRSAAGEVLHHSRQSTFHGTPLTLASVRVSAETSPLGAAK